MITQDDLIVAFYPCIYFCTSSQLAFFMKCKNYESLNDIKKIEKILGRSARREEFYERLMKFVSVCLKKHIRMIFENPYMKPSYLENNFLKNPDVIDMNRMERGDFFKKPTAYWFWNCAPTHGFSYQNDKKQKFIRNEKRSSKAGVCSIERSLISSDYARNWICDFVLGKEQENEFLLF